MLYTAITLVIFRLSEFQFSFKPRTTEMEEWPRKCKFVGLSVPRLTRLSNRVIKVFLTEDDSIPTGSCRGRK